LNTGMTRARGELFVLTDDDVEVDPGWLDAACDELDRDPTIEYAGGPVLPIWGAAPPAWFDRVRSDLWGTVAILDYGPERFIFEDRQRVPLGVNMAVRRRLIERVGGFHPELGRRGRSLLGQEQAEFFARARSRGTRGAYVPSMKLSHHVPASRLTAGYFRQWWFWKGVSRARVDGIHHQTELGLDLRQVPHIARVPRYVWGQIPRSAMHAALSLVRGDRVTAMRDLMHVFYGFGYVRACWAHEALQPMEPASGPSEPSPPPVHVQASPR
jgi:hypothetical protein